jgi:hypothetical protein
MAATRRSTTKTSKRTERVQRKPSRSFIVRTRSVNGTAPVIRPANWSVWIAPAPINAMPESSERDIRALLERHCIDWQYEPKEFDLDLTGHGRTHFKPDFFLPDHNIYLEISDKRFNDDKIAKINSLARVSGGAVKVILIDRAILAQLMSGRLNIYTLIAPEFADDFAIAL